MSNNRRRGKNLERYVAREFGGRRTAILGGEDVELKRFSVECKERETPMKTLDKWMAQVAANSRGKVPMVYFHVCNRLHKDDYVIFRAEDIQPIIQRIEDER